MILFPIRRIGRGLRVLRGLSVRGRIPARAKSACVKPAVFHRRIIFDAGTPEQSAPRGSCRGVGRLGQLRQIAVLHRAHPSLQRLEFRPLPNLERLARQRHRLNLACHPSAVAPREARHAARPSPRPPFVLPPRDNGLRHGVTRPSARSFSVPRPSGGQARDRSGRRRERTGPAAKRSVT